jgi:3-phosphoshikimate 1-carboxyvinyltransferase
MGFKAKLNNLSEARDTQTMLKLINSADKELNVIDAGTTMRFLTAYCAISNKDKVLTGTARMCERPIKLLVDALRDLGSEIHYLGKEGFPPIHVVGLNKQLKNKITIPGDVSSQYISALLMIAPYLNSGMEIELTGKVGSRPYIEMTLSLMEEFGVKTIWEESTISIKPQNYTPKEYSIESDWSGASYWFSFVALAENASLKLKGLKRNSLQGDIKIIEIMDAVGVKSEFDSEGINLSKKEFKKSFSYDFTHCPDLAQTVAVACAAKGIECTMTGLESLRIKETDRILALQIELNKIGGKLKEENEGQWKLIPSASIRNTEVEIETYDDHRMAMAFAPLAAIMNVKILEPSVVNKSYPSFWKDVERAGFQLEF